MHEQNTLGRRIQEGRRAAGLSQEALGEQLNVSRQAVSKWEADAAIPELENLIAMSRLFGVSIGQLLGVEPEQTPESAPEEGAAKEDGELTEAQLRMVREITDHYLAAQPERRRSPWGKWDRRILFALCGVMLVLLAGLSRRVSQLDDRCTGLQQSIGSITSSVNSQISSLTGQMSIILEEKNSILANSQVAVTDFDLRAETVTLSAAAFPKEWTDTTTALFTATLSDGRQFTAEAAGSGGAFTAEGFTVPMDSAIQLSVALTDDGASRTGSLETLYDCLPGCFQLAVDGSIGVTWSKTSRHVSLTGLNLYITQSSTPANPLALSPTAVDLCLYRNRETAPEQVIPVLEAVPLFQQAGYTDMTNFVDYQTGYDLAPGDTVVTAVRVTDDHGTTTWTILDIHGADEKGTFEIYPVSFPRLSPWTPGDPVT